MSLSLGLDINNFLTNSETQKSTLFDDIDKLFGNKPFLNNSTSDELFENSELNLLPDPSSEFLNLNSNSNGATNITSTEPLTTSHYNVGFPELSLDRIVPTNILPPQTLQYHQQQQSHQLSPILSDYNLYLNHDNNLISKDQINKCENQLDSVHIRKSSSTSEFKNTLAEPHINLNRTDSSVSSIGYQQLSNNCHQHLEHINGNSLCQPNNLLNTNNLPNGQLNLNNLPNGQLNLNNLPNGQLNLNNLPNGQLNLNNFPPNCLDLPVPPNINSNVVSLELNHYNTVNHINSLKSQVQKNVIPSQNIQKPPPKFINTFKPLIEPINSKNNSSVAKLIAESTKVDDQINDNNEIITNQEPAPILSMIKNEEINGTEQEASDKEILNKKTLTKKKRKKKDVKVETVHEECNSQKSQIDSRYDEVKKINSEQIKQNVNEPPVQKDSIQSFIEQFRADKDLTLITSEPSYQNVQPSAEPVKKNLKRKTKVNKKTAKKNKLDLDKSEVENDSPFSPNFKNILLDNKLPSNPNLISATANNQPEPQISLIKDNAGVFSANDNCNYELYSSNQINLIGTAANQVDTPIPSIQQQLSEFVYPTSTAQTLMLQKHQVHSMQQSNKIKTTDFKSSFNEENGKQSLNINNNQTQFKKNQEQELNEILDTSDLYALLSSNTEPSFKETQFHEKVDTLKAIDNETVDTSKEIKNLSIAVNQSAKKLKKVPKEKKSTVKKKKVRNQSVNSKPNKIEPELLNTKIFDTNSEKVVNQKNKNDETYPTNNSKTVCNINNSTLQINNNSYSFQSNEFDGIENENIKSGIYRKPPQQVKQIFKASENVFITKSNPSGAVIKMNQFEEIVLNFKNEYSNILNQNQTQFPPQSEFQNSVFSSFPISECTNKNVNFQENQTVSNYVNSRIVGSDSNLCADLRSSGNVNITDGKSGMVVDSVNSKGTKNKVLRPQFAIDKTISTASNIKLSQDVIPNPKYTAKDKLMILAYDILKLKNKNFTANREEMKLEVRDPASKKTITYKIIEPHDLSLNSKRLSDLLRLTPSKLNKLNKKKKSKINEQSSSLLTKCQPVVRTRYGRILKPTLPNDEIISLKVDKTKKAANNKINTGLSQLLKKQGTLVNAPSNGLENEHINSGIADPNQAIPKTKPAEKSPAVAKYKCQTCNKLFMGKRLLKHYISNPDHNPAIRKSRDIYELSLYKFLVEKIKNSSENEDNRVELFLNEISDLVEQLQIRSSKLVQSTSGIHLVNSKNCKILGIPEGHYSININGIDAIPDPITIDECDSNRLIAPPPVPRLDFSISLDDTITAKLNLSDNCNAPSEESLLRTVNDLVQTDIGKLDAKHLHYDQCDNAVEAMPIKVNETPILDLSLLFNNN